MGIFSKLLSEYRSAPQPPPNSAAALGAMIGAAGGNINEERALSLTAVWCAVRRISTAMSIFPLQIYQNLESGKRKSTDHILYNMLHNQPNPYQTASIWRTLMMSFQLMWGAGISEIEFDGRGYPVALWPIHPRCVTAEKTPSGKLVYSVQSDTGGTRILQPHQLLIFALYPTVDYGWRSPLTAHRETFRSALSVREFGAKSFEHGVNPAGIISGVAKAVTKEAEESRRAHFAQYAGLGNAHKLLILEDGTKFERVGMPPEDAQYLETRKFDTAEIARIFDVPLPLLHEHEKSTSWGPGLEMLVNIFVTFNMQPHCTLWEQEINSKLVGIDDNSYYCKFIMDGLLRGNTKDRMASYRMGASLGIYDIDEMREMEDRNPLPDGIGKARLVPMNMQPLAKVVEGDVNNA